MIEEILEQVHELNPKALSMDGYDDCVLGIMHRFGMEPLLAYDMGKIIEKNMADGMTHEEAVEFFEYNQIGAWMGEGTPVFVDLSLSGESK